MFLLSTLVIKTSLHNVISVEEMGDKIHSPCSVQKWTPKLKLI